MKRAVIFDCDGVLVDSEELAWQAWREVLAAYGYRPSDNEIATLFGRSAEEIHEHFGSRANISDKAAMKRALDSTMMRLFEQKLERFEDAVSLAVEAKARGLRIGVASSSDLQRVEKSLEIAGILDIFDAVVGGDEVPHGKPSPDVYLEAAHRLGVAPGHCVAVEDSRIGVAAATAAGMFVVAVLRANAEHADVMAASLVVNELTSGVLDAAFKAGGRRSPLQQPSSDEVRDAVAPADVPIPAVEE